MGFNPESSPGEPLRAVEKGAPSIEAAIALDETGAQQWNVLREDFPLPVAVLKHSALRRNSQWMKDYLRLTGAQIAPHGKTSMAPALFKMQLDDGAWGITLSTAHQIRIARQFGLKRIFLANQLIGPRATEFVLSELDEDPEFEFYCISDSLENVSQLESAAERVGARRGLNVLVELGFDGGRTGCRSNAEAMEVARAISVSRHLNLCGVEGFEGIIPGSPDVRLDRIAMFLNRIVAVVEGCSNEKLFNSSRVIITAGGSSFFDLVLDAFECISIDLPKDLIIRSGCYLTYDSVLYRRSFEWFNRRRADVIGSIGVLEPAIEVWTYVQSRPEPCRVIAMLGKRDISYDDLPIPLVWYRPSVGGTGEPLRISEGHLVTRLDDQHCYITVPETSPLKVGDLIGFGISHPCLTFDKWRVLHCVDDEYTVTQSIRTYF